MLNQSVQLESGFSFGGPLDRVLPHPILASHLIQVPREEIKGSDRFWMLEALRESVRGIGLSNPNPSVGCVLVDSKGFEISRGFTQAYGGHHAERNAFNQIQDLTRLVDATAYVTLEPCSHEGKQPPCAQLLVHSKIRRVVIARGDSNPIVNGAGIQKLKDAGKIVDVGHFSHEASAWNYPFFAQNVLNRPIFALKWAQTLDGQLADDSFHSKWITSAASRAYTHWLRQRYDAILIGARTLISDSPLLSARDCALPHQNDPFPIILDPKGLCLEISKDLQTQIIEKTFSDHRPILYLTTQSNWKKISSSWLTHQKNIHSFGLPGVHLIPEIISLLNEGTLTSLFGHAVQSIFVEGGAKTLTTFIQSGYADVLHVFVNPMITGGQKNRIFTENLLQNAKKFSLISQFRIENDVILEMIPMELKSIIFDQSRTEHLSPKKGIIHG